MFSIFERWVNPFPAEVPVLPRSFASFMWICSRGMRRYIAAMTFLTATLGAFEALAVQCPGPGGWIGSLKIPPAQLWEKERGHLLALAGILIGQHSCWSRLNPCSSSRPWPATSPCD